MLKRSVKIIIMLLAPMMLLSCGVIRVDDPSPRRTTVVYKQEQKAVKKQAKQQAKQQKKESKQQKKSSNSR